MLCKEFQVAMFVTTASRECCVYVMRTGPDETAQLGADCWWSGVKGADFIVIQLSSESRDAPPHLIVMQGLGDVIDSA
jgi:hypothetical protein